MMPVGVIGVNHKTAALKFRELFSLVCERRFYPGPFTSGSTHPSVLLSTCNRIEWYFSSLELPLSHSYFLQVLREEGLEELEPLLYSYFGADCLHHLARVTSGLDSALMGETEIQGQVKQAYETACSKGSLPKAMHYAFQKSLKIGKDVRSTFLPQEGAPELEHAILRLGNQHFPCAKQARLLFIGASEINCKVLRFLKAKDVESITLCNRTLDVAKEIAEHNHIDVLPWEQLHLWSTYDWIIVGTSCKDFILNRKNILPSFGNKRLIIDLSVPRNVDPSLNRRKEVALLNLDQLNDSINRKKARMNHAGIQADLFIRESTERLIDSYQRRDAFAHNYAGAGA